MTQSPENFDHLLDQALQSYTATEPRPGLQDRVLVHIGAQPAMPQFPGHLTRGLLWAGLATICLAIAATLFLPSRRAPEQKQEIARSISSPSSTPTLHPVIPPRTAPYIERAAAHRPHRTAKPQYGQPQPTQQDRLLVRFVALRRQDALNFAKQQQTPDQPISDQPIYSPPIVIAPISMDSKDQPSF